ncbi:MAG TPA: hemerythrin domain-containing protein [Nitrospirota bacterium]|nr:hemerythrin domain-containing protein [Nitrospirota bacterium]
MVFNVPVILNEEHQELHNELARIAEAGGAIGDAAKQVAVIMHPHFVKEEEYAMPPLGLLEPLSKGDIKEEMGDIIPITDKLKAMLPRMLSEHQAIVDALIKLTNVSIKEDRMEIAFIAKKLISHVRNEEEILYPAAILVGEYLRLKLNG